MENGNHQKVRGDQTVHAVSARFRKTRRYTKVVSCVLNLCTGFFHRKVGGESNPPCCERQIPQDEALYKSRLLRTEPCALGSFIEKVRGDQILHAVSARFRKIYYYTPLPLNLANKQQQASNNKQQQATTSNKHFSSPFWPLLRLIAPGSTLL